MLTKLLRCCGLPFSLFTSFPWIRSSYTIGFRWSTHDYAFIITRKVSAQGLKIDPPADSFSTAWVYQYVQILPVKSMLFCHYTQVATFHDPFNWIASILSHRKLRSSRVNSWNSQYFLWSVALWYLLSASFFRFPYGQTVLNKSFPFSFSTSHNLELYPILILSRNSVIYFQVPGNLFFIYQTEVLISEKV